MKLSEYQKNRVNLHFLHQTEIKNTALMTKMWLIVVQMTVTRAHMMCEISKNKHQIVLEAGVVYSSNIAQNVHRRIRAEKPKAQVFTSHTSMSQDAFSGLLIINMAR